MIGGIGLPAYIILLKKKSYPQVLEVFCNIVDKNVDKLYAGMNRGRRTGTKNIHSYGYFLCTAVDIVPVCILMPR